jgi:predicted dinucleotide-binding enzyme
MDVGVIGAGRLGQAMARTALGGLAWTGQVVIDATNDWPADDLDGTTSSDILAGLVPGARVVKAANTLSAEVLGSDPQEAGGRRVMFVSGDDADAKAQVVALFRDAGFAPVDLGDLATGGAMQQIHHPLAGLKPHPTRGAAAVTR